MNEPITGTNEERYNRLRDQARLSALITYGVDNWSFYGQACERAIKEGISPDTLEFLSVLDECGVDNWDGYTIAGESNSEYFAYLDDKYEHDDMGTALPKNEYDAHRPSPVTPDHTEPRVVKPKHVNDEYDLRVLDILSEHVDVVDEDAFIGFMHALKTRRWHPLVFDYAKHHVSDGVWQASEYKRQALSIYMSKLNDDDIINDWYEYNREPSWSNR
jgi:hypothetical protein